MTLLHDAYREAKVPFAGIDADNIKVGHALRQSANDEPEYMRAPEHDVRMSRGDMCDANAWREVSTGRIRMFCKGYDAVSRRWLALDDMQGRAAIDGETK